MKKRQAKKLTISMMRQSIKNLHTVLQDLAMRNEVKMSELSERIEKLESNAMATDYVLYN